MGDIKTPSSAKGSQALKILRKTAQSVYAAKIPPRSLRNVRHSHALVTARHVKRIDRHPWEERVADILQVLEEQRYGKANALHQAMDRANQAVLDVSRQKADLEVHSEELTAANEEMRATNEEMRATNEEMRATNEEMRALSEELERVHTDIELFAPLASEKIAAPLAVISQGIETVMAQHSGKMDKDAIARLSEFSRTTSAISAFMGKMIAYWQVELDGKPFETTDCEKLFLQVQSDLQERLVKTNTRITHDPIPPLEVDDGQFKTLVQILLENAVIFNHTETPRIHVSVTTIEDAVIEIPEPKIEGGWVFCVSDNGPGINESSRADIFNIFKTLDPEKSGMGMGLAIAWRIVKRHGGNIWVTAGENQGSRFYFTLPAYE